MNFIIIRIIYSLVSLLISFLLFQSYKREGKKNKNLRDFSVFFLLFAFYRVFLISYLFTDNLKSVALNYDIAVMLYFIMVAIALKIALSFLKANFQLTISLIGSLLFIGASVVFYQIITLNIPEITPTHGIVFWNVNPIALYITGMSGFIVAHFWVYIFYLNFRKGQNKLSKLKSFLIMISSSAFGFSSLTYFSPNKQQ